jgi:ABC-2 type transport system permease protein
VTAIAGNSFTLLLRNEFRLYLRGGFVKGASLVFFIISQVLLHLFALSIALASTTRSIPQVQVSGVFMLAAGLMAMFMLMTSRSLASAVTVLYTRGDLDLLLASPVDRRAVLGVRMGGVALTVALEVALLVWPFANVFVLFGDVVWLKAYLLVPAMAMLATSIGLALTLLSFRTLGPRRTRMAVQVLAVVVGMGIMLAIYLPRMLGAGPDPGAGRRYSDPNPLSGSMSVLEQGSGSVGELLVVPAQWVMHGFLPTLAFLIGSAALLAFTIHLAGDRIVSAMTAIPGAGARKTLPVAATSSALQFHQAFRTVVVVKELKLIARDPYLVAQLLQQGLFALPAAFALWSAGRTSNLPLPWLAIIVVVAGIAGPLAWITITAEDAPDLLASAPVSRASLIRAKIEAALLPVLPLCLLPLLFLSRTHPWFAFSASFCAAAAALSAALINMGNPVAKRRDSLKQRHKGNGGRGFLEVVSLVFWVLFAVGMVMAGRYLAGWR